MSSIPCVFREKYSSEMTEDENVRHNEVSMTSGPLSLLYEAVEGKQLVLVSLRSNRKVIARVKAYDKHFNMLLKDAVEVYRKRHKGNIERALGSLFLRGDNVILVTLLKRDTRE